MLTHNKISWMSIVKSKVWLPAMAIALMSGTAQAQWALVDNFEGHTAGSLVDTFVGPSVTWTGGSTQHTAEVDPTDAANLAMKVNGLPGNAVLRAELGSADFIAFGATGTLFYRFRTAVGANGTSDHVIGLTDNNAITNFNFKSGLRNIVPAGSNTLDLRDGVDPGYEEVATLADDTWYSLWMVSVNTNPGTFECYLQSPTDPNFAEQRLLVGDDVWDYRINGDTDIINVYFRNANNAGGVEGNDLYIDDIYINSSAEDLTDPLAITDVLLGDVNLDNAVNFADIGPFIAVLSASGSQAEADVDGSGTVDFGDIGPFIALLSQ